MCLFPQRIRTYRNGKSIYMYSHCGKCIECLNLRTSDWSFRMVNELNVSNYAVFVTLTYNDDNISADGVHVDHLQKFFKRLRKAGLKFSYFAIGEYGTTTFRPHYHLCIFIKNDFDFYNLHKLIEDKWSFGFIKCVPLTRGRMRYCVAYLIGQSYPEGKNKPFTLVSKNPALGSNLLADSDFITQCVNDDFSCAYLDGRKVHLPRYYKKRIATPEESFNATIYVKMLCSEHLRYLDAGKQYFDIYGGDLNEIFRKSGNTYDEFCKRNNTERVNYDKRKKFQNKKLRNDL